MGQYSWLTSDSNLSIPAESSGYVHPPVYLLQPNRAKPVCETRYQGYGVFGGIDAFVWLAETNLPGEILDKLDHEQKRSFGLFMHNSELYQARTGQYFVSSLDQREKLAILEHMGYSDVMVFDNYGSKIEIDDVTSTVNDHVFDDRLVEISFPVKYGIKLSYDSNALYEDVPVANRCPFQGLSYKGALDYLPSVPASENSQSLG